MCAALTLDKVGDTTALPEILDQINGPVSRSLAPLGRLLCNGLSGNGWCLRRCTTDNLLKARFGETVEIIIPPPKNAAQSSQSAHHLNTGPWSHGVAIQRRL